MTRARRSRCVGTRPPHGSRGWSDGGDTIRYHEITDISYLLCYRGSYLTSEVAPILVLLYPLPPPIFFRQTRQAAAPATAPCCNHVEVRQVAAQAVFFRDVDGLAAYGSRHCLRW